MKRAAASPAFTPRRHDRERRSHRSSHMEPQTLVALLAISAVFGSLAASDRDAIASCMLRMHFEPGHVIFSRGDLAREMYLVLEGKVRLSVLTSDARELSFAHAGPGNIFGEIAALDGGERTASATAINRVQVMALPQRAILDLIENNPTLAVAAIRFLCTRLRETDLLLEAIALHRIEVRLSRLLLSAEEGTRFSADSSSRESLTSMRWSAIASSSRSVSRSRVHRKRIAATASVGLFSIKSKIARCGSAMTWTRLMAVALAVRSPPSSVAISPKMLPGPACAKESSRPSLVKTDRRTLPSSTRYISRAGSPREKIIWPGSKCMRCMRLAIASRSKAASAPNTADFPNNATSACGSMCELR